MTGSKINVGYSDQTDGWKFTFWYIQETINKETCTMYKKPKLHLKISLDSY